jgi:hypothetical protein
MRNCASEVWSFGPSRNDGVTSLPPPSAAHTRGGATVSQIRFIVTEIFGPFLMV